MIKKCEDCKNKIICIECGRKLCNLKNDQDCFIEGYYLCPRLGVICINCENKVKFDKECLI